MPTKLPDIEPVALQPWAKPFDGPEWTFEPKYDGFRGLLYASATGCEIKTSRVHRAERFAELRQRVAQVLNGRQAVLDGEVVALDGKGKPIFRDLLKGRGYWAFAAADVVWLDGQDLNAFRLPTAIFGALTVPALYWLCKHLFDRRTAFVAALVLAALPVHIQMSRVGMNNARSTPASVA